MSEPTLFGSSRDRPDVERDEQWRLESLLLCNWGGFGGLTVFDVHQDSTLLSGASGAGKSTVLDGYSALLNPARPFNVASNDAGARRNEGARTTLTYVRGQFDRIERDGALVPQVLRGENQDTWSALAAVFATEGGARLSLLRLFFAGQEAALPSDMTTIFAVFDGRMERRHLERLEPVVVGGLRKERIEKVLSGFRVLNQGQYIDAVQSKLHIGTGGDTGPRALRLLHELQSGKPQPSVDALFKQMVLEVPVTYDEADKAILSFDKLDQGYQEIIKKEKQLEILKNIEVHHAELSAAQVEIERFQSLRIADPGGSPFQLWANRCHIEAYARDIVLAEESIRLHTQEKQRFEGLRSQIEIRLQEANQMYLAGGGATKEDVRRQIVVLRERRDQVRVSRCRFEELTRCVLRAPESETEFEHARGQAEQFLSSLDEAVAELRRARIPFFDERGVLRTAKGDAEAELRHLRSQNSNIPRDLHELRVRFAESAGLDPADLPFAGELIDVHADHEEWRTAADAVLGAFAFRLLLDEGHLRALRRGVNEIRSPLRLNFDGVPVWLPVRPVTDFRTLAGRLLIKEGPFAGWLRDRLDTRYSLVCVRSADEFAEDGQSRVTPEGQVQQGRSGAHGGNVQRRIGFTNEHRRGEVAVAIQDIERRLTEIESQLVIIDQQEVRLTQEKEAWREISRTSWRDIDVESVEGQIEAQNRLLDEIVAGAPELEVLSAQLDTLSSERDDAFGKAITATRELAEAEGRRRDLELERSIVRRRIDDLESDETIRLSATQVEQLDAMLTATEWDFRGATFGATLTSIRKDLAAQATLASERMTVAETLLTTTFQLFQTQWPDPSRGTLLPSYDDYLAVLLELRSDGLADQRENWSRTVIEYSGDRLSVLNNSYGRARSEIDERLEPIRRILLRIPFGNRPGETLDISVQHRRPDSVDRFQQRLRALAAGTMVPGDSGAAETKFAAIREVLASVRAKSVDRDLLLDVRRHLRVTARVLNAGGRSVAAYDHISDKSGGEAQMITAFICGAALRYRLGDEDRQRPRFAPIVLDEAFIKADGRYTMLAVQAWRTLGFQLVIGAPEEKFNGIEPAVGLVVGIAKGDDEHSYVIPVPRKPPAGST